MCHICSKNYAHAHTNVHTAIITLTYVFICSFCLSDDPAEVSALDNPAPGHSWTLQVRDPSPPHPSPSSPRPLPVYWCSCPPIIICSRDCRSRHKAKYLYNCLHTHTHARTHTEIHSACGQASR